MNRKKLASSLFPRYSGFVAAVNMNANMRKWLDQHDNGRKCNTRKEIFNYVSSTLTDGAGITRLEFGVFEGSSLAIFPFYWI